MQVLVKNGVLVSGNGEKKGDVLIKDGKISGTGLGFDEQDTQVIDASGCYVFPGFIDAHTHLDLECAAGFTADDFRTGTRAALAGGTTTILDFATQDKGQTLEQGLAAWFKKAEGKAACDYGFHMAITDWTDDIPEQMEDMCRKGITSFKVYLAYDNLRLTAEQVEKVLATAAKLGAVVCAHCEDGDAVNRGIAGQKELGVFSPVAHPASRPNNVEADAVKLFLSLARKTGAQAYVVHLSTAEGMQAIRDARAGGQEVFAETCPQYLTLTDEVYSLLTPESMRYVCSPPLRSVKDRDALRKALLEGEMQVVATDHCSFRLEQKAIGKDDFSLIPNGLPGIEHRAAVMYALSKDVCPLTPSQLCAVLSENPAKIFGMYPQKGCLQAGADADLVIWSPDTPMVISAENQLQAVEYTPFEGMKIPGSPKYVLLRGEVVATPGHVTDAHRGAFIARRPKKI